MAEHRPSSVFATVKLGTRRSVHKLREALEHGNFHRIIWPTFGPVLDKVRVAKPKANIEVDLVYADPIALGFDTNRIRRDAIYSRAQELGLLLCPAEAGPQLVLQGWHLQEGPVLFLAMEPIEDQYGHPCVFHVWNIDNERWISLVDVGNPEQTYSLGMAWVFVQPRR